MVRAEKPNSQNKDLGDKLPRRELKGGLVLENKEKEIIVHGPNQAEKGTINVGRKGSHSKQAAATQEHKVVFGNKGDKEETTLVVNKEKYQPLSSKETDHRLIGQCHCHFSDSPDRVLGLKEPCYNVEEESENEMEFEGNEVDPFDEEKMVAGRGAAARDFHRTLQLIIKLHSPVVLGFVETKISGTRASDVCKSMGFDNWDESIKAMAYCKRF
ncbi:hypothetical protein DITRI_Ditri15bG0099100 [Diplodiscus trichospermus]